MHSPVLFPYVLISSQKSFSQKPSATIIISFHFFMIGSHGSNHGTVRASEFFRCGAKRKKYFVVLSLKKKSYKNELTIFFLSVSVVIPMLDAHCVSVSIFSQCQSKRRPAFPPPRDRRLQQIFLWCCFFMCKVFAYIFTHTVRTIAFDILPGVWTLQ